MLYTGINGAAGREEGIEEAVNDAFLSDLNGRPPRRCHCITDCLQACCTE